MDIPPSIHKDRPVTIISAADKAAFDWLRACAEYKLNESRATRQTLAPGKPSHAQPSNITPPKELVNCSRQVRLAATVPAIAQLLKTKQIDTSMFLGEKILRNKWYDLNYSTSPYKTHLRAFIANNPKFEEIKRTILPVLQTAVLPIKDTDRVKFPKAIAPKIIIMTIYPAIAFITSKVSLWPVNVFKCWLSTNNT
jgi:hypothetical protein